MYVIYNRDEGMYLLGTQNSPFRALTCLWGSDLRDALAYEDIIDARLLLRRIGTRGAEIKRVQARQGGAQ